LRRRRHRLGRPATAPPPPPPLLSRRRRRRQQEREESVFALKRGRERKKRKMRGNGSCNPYILPPNPTQDSWVEPTQPTSKAQTRAFSPKAQTCFLFIFCTPPAFIFFFTRIMFIIFTHLYSYYIFFFDAF